MTYDSRALTKEQFREQYNTLKLNGWEYNEPSLNSINDVVYIRKHLSGDKNTNSGWIFFN
jgi:hypothetical protein